MREELYLAIPHEYGRWLGGLRWGEDGDAIEYAADEPEVGLTFAMGAEVALILEGAAAADRPPHFAFVLHFLHLLGFGSRHVRGVSGRSGHEELARAFRETGRPLRNAGVLCAAVCRDLPGLADPPKGEALQRRLEDRLGLGFYLLRRTASGSAAAPDEFDARARVGPGETLGGRSPALAPTRPGADARGRRGDRAGPPGPGRPGPGGAWRTGPGSGGWPGSSPT